MKKSLLVTALLSSLALPAAAQNLYVFADVERNKIEADAGRFSISNSENGFGLGVGYAFNNTFAIEVAYRDLMNISDRESFEDYEYSSDLDITAFQLSVLGNYALNEQVAVFGRLGVARIEFDIEEYENDWGDTYTDSSSESKTRALIGVGASYAFNENLGARVEYNRFADIEDITLSSLSIGLTYSF